MSVRVTIPPERRRNERAAGTWLDRFIDGYVTEAAVLVPERPVVIDGEATLTYGAAEAAIGSIARSLHSLGTRRGDVVSWQLPNWHEAFLLHHAILRAGAVSNPIVPIYRRHEVEYMLRESGSRVFVIPETFRGFDYVAMAAEMMPALPDLDHVVVARPQQPQALTFAELSADSGPPLDIERSPDDPMLLMFTSGTTAQPKGVLHTHNTLDCENRSIIDLFELTSDERIFMASPVTHITGLLYALQLPAMLKAPVVMQDVWEPRAALGLLAEHRCTFTVAATPFLHGVTHHPERDQFDLGALRVFACGGADVPPALVRDARTFLDCFVARIYGSTELPTLSCTGPREPALKASQTDGRALGRATYRIVDNAGDEVPLGSIGELEADGPEGFVGYLRPEHAADAFTADGWFRTGDLACADEAGYLSIRGRSKDIILRGGENISVTEVEALLFEHPDVAEVAVVAMPDPVMVERACAFVVPRAGTHPTLTSTGGRSPSRSIPNASNSSPSCPRRNPARSRSTCYARRFADCSTASSAREKASRHGTARPGREPRAGGRVCLAGAITGSCAPSSRSPGCS
jgi:cyclohexanecarboxylate-CoA ligase